MRFHIYKQVAPDGAKTWRSLQSMGSSPLSSARFHFRLAVVYGRVQFSDVKLTVMLNWHRILSGSLAVIYILFGFAGGGGEGGLIVMMFVFLPLAAIWFGDAMGGYTGPTTGMPITAASPAALVRLAGWLVLLMPIAAVLLQPLAR